MNNPKINNLERSIFSGIQWNLILSSGGQIVNVGFTLLLSRLLDPGDFGLLAVATAIIGLIGAFGPLGSVAALTQRRVMSDQFYSAVVVVVAITSCIILVVLACSASLLTSFYGLPDLKLIFLLLLIPVPFQAIEILPFAELQRQLAFEKIALYSFISVVVSGLISIYLAYTGEGWIALVVRIVVLQIVRTLLFCTSAWPSFMFKPRKREIRELLRYGLPQSVTEFLSLFGRRIDDILIGKWMGAGPLGVYSLAYNLYLWPISNIKGRISQVLFAALSKVQSDHAAMGSYYLKTVSLATLIGFPVIMGFGAICDLAVPVVMGEKWNMAIPVLRTLALASIFEIGVFPGAIYQAIGHTKSFLKIIFVTRLIATLGIIMALFFGFGLQGVSMSLVVTSFISLIIYNFYVGKIIKVTPWAFVQAMVHNGFFSVIMLLMIIGFRYFFGDYFAPLSRLILSILIGGVGYLLLMKRYRPYIFKLTN